MITVEHTPGALKKFRRTPWRFQQTVEWPNNTNNTEDRAKFVETIFEANGQISEGTVVIDEVVFNATETNKVCANVSADVLGRDWAITCSSQEEMKRLLMAVFHDGMDFIYAPNPKPFVFYADHDDWITFYANTKSNLNMICQPLEAAGFKMIENWQREF